MDDGINDKRGQTKDVIPPRKLTAAEKRLLEYLLSEPFPGRDELVRQLLSAEVTEEYRCCPSIMLSVNRSRARRSHVKRRVPVEAQGVDSSGVYVHVLLHVDDGFLSELEVYREGEEEVESLPAPGSLELIHLDD